MSNKFSQLGIQDILPHREPMLMVSEVVSRTESTIHCLAHVGKDNPFLAEGILPAFVGLELIAQASGLFLGLVEQERQYKRSASGAIVAVRDLVLADDVIKQDAVLDIRAEFLGGSQQAAQFSGQVLLGETEVCRTRVTIAMLEEGE